MIVGNNKRRFSGTDDNEENFERLVAAINEPVNLPPLVAPTPPLTDKAALYGQLVATQLREINPQYIDDIMVKVLQMLNDFRKTNPN